MPTVINMVYGSDMNLYVYKERGKERKVLQ